MRILFGAMEVSAVCQRSDAERACARRSLSTSVLRGAMTLHRAVKPIAEIAEPGHDVLVLVQLAVDHRRVDVGARMMPFDERDAFRGGDDADDPDGSCARALEHVERGDRASAG